MIRASAIANESLARSLTERAEAIAAAAGERAALARLDSPARWRRAALIWPLFTRGN